MIFFKVGLQSGCDHICFHRLLLSTSFHGASLLGKCQDLRLTVGDQDRVLIMCRKTSVFCHNRPVVIQPFYIRTAGIDHRLNRKSHPLYDTKSTVSLAEIRNLRILMKRMADAVPDQIPDAE